MPLVQEESQAGRTPQHVSTRKQVTEVFTVKEQKGSHERSTLPSTLWASGRQGTAECAMWRDAGHCMRTVSALGAGDPITQLQRFHMRARSRQVRRSHSGP